MGDLNLIFYDSSAIRHILQGDKGYGWIRMKKSSSFGCGEIELEPRFEVSGSFSLALCLVFRAAESG